MANRDLPPEYRADGRGLALESLREVEQYRKAGGLLRWRRRTGGRNSQLLGLSSAASRIQPWGWQRLVTSHRRRRAFLLEEQSLSDEGVHGRRRLASSTVGHDRPRHENRSQCDSHRLGRSLREE